MNGEKKPRSLQNSTPCLYRARARDLEPGQAGLGQGLSGRLQAYLRTLDLIRVYQDLPAPLRGGSHMI